MEWLRTLCLYDKNYTKFYSKRNNNNRINNKQRDLFEMTTIGFNTRFQSLRKVIHDLLQCFNANFVPCLHQGALQRFDVCVRLSTCFLLKNAPHWVVQRVQIRWSRWPLVSGDEVRISVAQEVLGFVCLVCGDYVLLKAPPLVAEMLLVKYFPCF